MVREIERKRQTDDFPETAPAANPVFFRTYSRRIEGNRESWGEVCDRTTRGLAKLGKLTLAQTDLLYRMMSQLKSLPSGRWLWVGGSEWIEQEENFSGAYNCTSTNVIDWQAFGLMMDLAMMGCGTGAVLEPKYIDRLPPIRNKLNVTVEGEIGTTSPDLRREETEVKIEGNKVTIYVGDSRQGWVKSYQTLLELSTDEQFTAEVDVIVDINDVRPAGEPLKGFGGVANPVKLASLYHRCAAILNKALGRQLNSVECCLLIDEAAVTIVAGNIRRCIAYGERVSAISGMKPIQDIAIGELVLTSSGEYKPVTNKFLQGIQDVVEIRTAETSIRCTANHRVAVYNSLQSYTWKYAGELQPGDRLISVPHRKGMPCSTTDYAWLVGFFIGDGHADIASSKRSNSGGGCVIFAFSQARLNGDLGQKCLRILKTLGYTPSISINENNAYIKVYRKELAEELIKYKQPWGTPIIPEFVWLGTEEIRGAFLAGLADADAGPSRNVLLNSNKLEFLRQVQRLALSLGIATTLHERSPKMLKGRDTFYEGCHWLKIRGIQSQVNTVALVNPQMGCAGFRICGQKKNGLSLPYQFIQEAMASGWRSQTVRNTKSIIDPSRKGGSMRDANWDTLLSEGIVNPHWLPLEVQLVVPAGKAETFDIEVESDREFIVSGLLAHNSAGMRQGDSEDELFSNAKTNLWQQDENGNWRIDPERDALRMANHTRVFHKKPTREECIAAVRQQYYSGEGAIQWAGEAVARSNIDLLNTEELKKDFLQAYEQGKAKAWIQEHHQNIDDRELDHRLGRYGLNPCHAGDTLVSTNQGLVPIKDLVGKPFQALIDLRAVGLDGVRLTDAIAFPTGVKTTYVITLVNGQQMRCTADHQHFTNQGWVTTKDLTSEHHIYIQKGAGSFGEGAITVEQAQMLGWWYGDDYNVIIKPQKNGRKQSHFAKGFVFNQQEYDYAYPVVGGAIKSIAGVEYARKLHKGVDEFRTQSPLLEEFFRNLEIENKNILPVKILTQSQEVLIGFLQGIFSADGTVEKNCRRIKLVNESKALLQQIQLILLQLGILSTVRCVRKQGYRGVVHTTADGTQKISADNSSYALCIHSFGYKLFHQLIGFPLSPAKEQRLAEWDAKPLPNYTAKTINSCFTAQVKTVEEFGEEPVYDLHVPLTHSFIANGCITHNCGEILGANFHCVSGETILITRDGLHQIQDIVGQRVEIWNGKRWSQVVPVQTGINRTLYRVSFGDGTYLDVTEKHRFFVKDRFGKEYQELSTGELAQRLKTSKDKLHTEAFQIIYLDGKFIDPTWAYTLGQLVGDGSLCKSNGKPQLQLPLYGVKRHLFEKPPQARLQELTIAGRTSGEKRYYTESKEVPCLLYTGFQKEFDPEVVRNLKNTATAFDEIAAWNRESILHFIAGLADADGSTVSSGGIRIYISDYQRAYRIYLLLIKCGIRSSINLLGMAGSATNLVIRDRDLWYLQITDCAAIPCQRLDTSGGHQPKAKGKYQIVKSVELLPGNHDTFCFNEPEFHKGVFGGTLTGQCNLSEIHLNQIDPKNTKEQEEAFTAGALSVATLLNHKFVEPRYQYSREIDPIVGVSFTGLFDFFVTAFGVDWLQWWEEGRPDTVKGLAFKEKEKEYLTRWKDIVHQVISEYCDNHNLKRPNRCTTVQPSGTKSLLSSASPGWHPPKAQRFIRRITFRKNDPVALACLDYGYSIIPSQSDKDEHGNLLKDPFDSRCSEWLVEIPVAVPWADLPGADTIEISKFSALAQMDFAMQVQRYYVTHNTSSTWELRENEVEPLGERIYEAIQNDEGYISAALLARFDDHQSFPRLPFEPIDKETYEQLMAEVKVRRKTDDFRGALSRYDAGELPESGPAGCDSDKCLLPEQQPS